MRRATTQLELASCTAAAFQFDSASHTVAVGAKEVYVQLEEELSCVVLKTGHGMDKGDDASVNLSQRKVPSLNCRGTFNHERFGRTITIIWKYLHDKPVLFWFSWPEEKKRVAWENFQV
ncbi:hypothetical protein SLEP1_g23218 [Rubroshorea leprosula]|uniref:Uncharacterized protein n=1 Tax=Rubroshorea leprosula TaxID=152421 RepID=A0AAV5JEQ3_9ROSI|nr:hypothetical protein SLEP1_g23218 [Rubroshorea leprosula]